MMTKDEARRAVEAELRSRKLTTPMTLEQLNAFCEEMYKQLQFRSKTERLTDILKWAEDWQAKNLRSSSLGK
jgi:UDP-glucose 4-epimerase